MSSVITPRSYIDMRNASAVADAGTPGITKITVTPEDSSQGFFNPGGPTFRDVLDAVNPLNHIPIVSGLLADATGHKVSVGAKVIGGAMFGPVGLASSLINAIFEQQTGKDVAGSMVAALSGQTPAATQLASNEKTEGTEVASNDATAEAEEGAPQQVAMLDTKGLTTNDMALNARLALANNGGSAGNDDQNDASAKRNQAVLALYGNSASANQAYQKAQFLPYLKNASTTQIM